MDADPEASRAEIKLFVKNSIEHNDVVIFSKSWCPYCTKAKTLLREKDIQVVAFELDQLERGNLIQNELAELTNQTTVPNIFIKGNHIGGCSDLEEGIRSGKLEIWMQGSIGQFDYDVFVVGGGSGGLAAAKEAAKYKKKVALCDFVEPTPIGTKWGLGGTCVNVGCIPKKLMHRAANLHHDFGDAPSFGWRVPIGVEHDWAQMVENVQGYIKSLNWNYRKELRSANVAYMNALARLVDPHTLELTDARGKTQTVTAQNIIISVGGRPTYPEIPGAREYCITSDDLFSLQNNPGKVLVVGASYVALECAGFLAGIGNDVTVMVRSILLRGFDQTAAERIGKHLESEGVKMIRGCVPESVEKIQDEPLLVKVTGKKTNGDKFEDTFNTVILAIGRHPNTKKLGLDELGVKLADNGKVYTNENDQSSVSSVYAIGDVAFEKPELTPVAILAGRLLAQRLCGDPKATLMDYSYIPTTVFTPLEYGCVGESEEAAIQKYSKENITVYHTLYRPLEVSITDRMKSDCYAKLICLGPEKRVIGFHVLGPNAGEITQGFALALKLGATKSQFDMLVGIHPTCAEVFTNVSIDKASGVDLDKAMSGC